MKEKNKRALERKERDERKKIVSKQMSERENGERNTGDTHVERNNAKEQKRNKILSKREIKTERMRKKW